MALDLGKQIGPLPLGAWVIVVGGGLGIAIWSRNQADSSSDTTDTSTDVSGGSGTGGLTSVIPTDPSDTGDDSSSDNITYDTNEAWGQAAITWLIAQGYPPGTANSAITKALNGGTDISGNKMSVTEFSLWSLALAHFGSPPYPVSVQPPTSTPGPVTPSPPVVKPVPLPLPRPVPKPPIHVPTAPKGVPPHYSVIVKRGDTLTKIGSKYGKSASEVWAFNLKYRSAATIAILKKRGPNLLYAGETIWVPKS